MTSSISTNDATIQSGTSSAQNNLDTTMAGSGSRAPSAGVDPRLTAAVDDAGAQNRRSAERAGDDITRTSRDSAGKTDIDKGGAERMGGTGAGGKMDSFSKAMLGALGAAGSALGGGGGGGGGAPAGGGMPSMPQMPMVPAASAGQSIPSALSNPVAAQLMARLLSGDSSVVGSGGLMSSGGMLGGGGRGGSGLAGPNGTGGNKFEQKVIALARQVVGARLPYTWGGGTINGPSQGIRDGGAADAAGDYRKTGFDCSSLARYLVYQASGVEIPRTSQAQFSAGMTVSPSDARPGDLLFPSHAGIPPHHVQVYVGGGKVVEAQQSGTNLMFSNAGPGTFKRYVVAH